MILCLLLAGSATNFSLARFHGLASFCPCVCLDLNHLTPLAHALIGFRPFNIEEKPFDSVGSTLANLEREGRRTTLGPGTGKALPHYYRMYYLF